MQKSSLHDRLANALRSAREKAGLSQRALAAKLGTNQTQVSFIESGAQPIRATELVEWCDAVGADPVEMLRSAIEA